MTIVPLTASEESAIRETVRQMEETWNRHDMTSYAALLTEEVRWVNIVGMWWQGKAEVGKAHEAIHPTSFHDVSIHIEQVAGRKPSADAAVAVITESKDAFTTLSGHNRRECRNRLPAVALGFTLAAVLCLPGSPARAAEFGYELLDLGTLGGQNSQGFGLSNAGVAVGSSLLNGNADTHAFSFATPGGPMADLPTLGGQNGAAFGVGDGGIVVGEAQNDLGDTRAVIWDNGTPTDLGVLDGGVASSAKAINAAGTVVGVSTDGVLGERAFRYDGVSLADLGTLGGATAAAYGVNADGVVVGYSADAGGTRRAFRWDAVQQMTDLLGGAADGDAAAWAASGGFAYGQFTTVQGDRHAFRYDLAAALLMNLGTLGGDTSVAFGGNAAGLAVGTARDGFGDDLAFLYRPVDGILPLNALLVANPDGVTLTEARGINDANDVVATGRLPNGDVHAFFLKQVAVTAPEPTPILPLLLGAAPLLLYHRRRKAV